MRNTTLVLVFAILTAACTNASPDAPVLPSVVEGAVATTVATTQGTIVDADPVRAQLDWFVRAINGGPLSEEVYEERFAEVFRRQVPFEAQFSPIVEQLDAISGSWLVVSFEETQPGSGVGIVVAGDERMQVSLTVAPDPPHLISGLLVQPADLPSEPDSLENAVIRLERLGDLRFLAAEIVDGNCVPLSEVAASQPMPLGSVFKLFVLGALGNAVAEGEVAWTDEIVIRDELKSIPSGILQDEPDGTVKTVREVAELMISISDNTAADHLIDLLGRERIEAGLADMGLSEPELNIPFLTTLEFAALKAGPGAGLRDRYLAADVDGKRDILEQLSDLSAADIPVAEFDTPIDPDKLEWFASPSDICATMAKLWIEGDDTVRAILTVNPGVAPESGLWEQVAFKGGSEPGLITVAWLTVDAGGRIFSVSGSVLDTVDLIDELEAVFVFAGARDLLAQ